MTSFSDLGLTDDVNRAIGESGYKKPTEIQSQMIPVIRDGHDVIGLSQTGSGKTAAFVLPLMDQLVKSKKRARRGGCTVLVVSPTRELSNQIADTVRRYGKYVNYAQTIIVGGVSYPPQIRALNKGVDIVVATPGRILDHIESGVVSMDETNVIVLDEADQMLDFGFFPVIRKIMEQMPEDRQTILTSATMPKAIKDLTKEFMKKPKLIEATPESRPVETIDQQVIYVEKHRKNMALLEIIAQKDVERSIVFTRTKFGADRVQRFLNNYGVLAVSLHGNKSQGQRQRALKQFRSGEAEVMVATDVAGRGIDIDDVTHVINVDLPNVAESYVHRIGRTGRAGRKGVAISFCSKPERGYLRDIERLIGTKLDKREDKPGAVPPMAVSAEPIDMDKMEDETRGRKMRDGGSRSRSARPPRSTRKSDGDRRSDRPRSDRPRSDRPSRGDWGDKPRDDRPRSDRPRSDRPRSDRPSRGDWGDKPRDDRPRGDRPSRGDWGDKPRGDRPLSDRPRGDRPSRGDWGDKPRGDRPRSDRPRSDRPRSDRPSRGDWGDKPRGDRPRSDRPRSDRPRSDRPSNDRPSRGDWGDKPRGDRPRSDRPRSDKPSNDGPRDDQFSGKLRAKPYKGKPGGGKAFKAKPANGKPQRGRSFAATAEQGLKRRRG